MKTSGRAAQLLLVCLLVVVSVGCARIPRSRKLPRTIQSVCVPLAQNNSAEPGVEEVLTRELQEALLADGELRVRNRGRADMALGVVFKKYLTRNTAFESDRFPTSAEVTMVADVYLYNIEDTHRAEPALSWLDVEVQYQFSADPRRVTDITDVDARKRALWIMADGIVDRVLYEDSEEMAELKRDLAEGKLKMKIRPSTQPVVPPANQLPE